jgi:hypothetical protein
MKTSVKMKKFWFADIASDGGVGTNWTEIQIGVREATAKFTGSAASINEFKNIIGGTLEAPKTKGSKTCVFQLADITPSLIAEFTGGTVTSDANSDEFAAPLNENQTIEKSIRFLTDQNVLVTLPRVSFDGYPFYQDDDLHYYQMDGIVLQPTKITESSYKTNILKLPAANDILTFVLAAQTGAAVISAVTHTVAITVATGTVVTALEPVIGVSLGASISPASGAAQNFTAPIVYSVESANGTKQDWTVTVTIAT